MNRLTEKHFSFKCPMDWDDMPASANGRFCNQCRKEVFDLTHCSLDDVAALQRKHGSICGTIRIATIAASLSAAACQEPTTGNICPTVKPPPQTGLSSKAILGGVIADPINPLEKPGR